VAQAKYREYIERMMNLNQELFERFRRTHDNYALNPQKFQSEFNKIGSEAMEVIREYEDRLCGMTESGGYSKYSGNLAEKYQNELRRIFPKIDSVGIVVEEEPLSGEDEFVLPKINL